MIKTLNNLTRKEVIFLLLAILLLILQGWLDLKIPDYMSKVTMLVQTKGTDTSEVIKSGIIMLLCSLGSLVTAFGVGFLAAYTGTSFEKNLRKKVFNKIHEFGTKEIKGFSTSSLITRNTNDITQIKTLVVMGIQMLAKAPIMAIMAIMKIAGKEWNFSLITLVGVSIVIVSNLVIILVAIPKFKKIQRLTDNLNAITRENLTGLRVVRAYNAEDFELNRFEKANKELTDTHLFTGKLMAFMGPIMSSIMSGLSLAIYWVGAVMINGAIGMDKLNIFSDMVVFSAYAVQVIMAFMVMVMLFILYPRASVSMKRVNEVLDTEIEIKYGNVSKDTSELRGTVEFKGVSFKYPDAEEYVLKNISFTANKGETIAIIGGTGSGKSTLVNLIPRFYDASEGEILIDGINIKDMTSDFLTDKLGYISQKAVLFKGSIKENIKLGKKNGKKVSNDDVLKALNIARASEFVTAMDKGVDSDIASAGNNISGGQKQRLSIARAIARDAEIYIFDDSFSALDYKTDYALRKNLEKYTGGSTKFIVASRIGTIKDADKIIVLDEGEMVGIGTHESLLKDCEVYKQIAASQYWKEAK